MKLALVLILYILMYVRSKSVQGGTKCTEENASEYFWGTDQFGVPVRASLKNCPSRNGPRAAAVAFTPSASSVGCAPRAIPSREGLHKHRGHLPPLFQAGLGGQGGCPPGWARGLRLATCLPRAPPPTEPAVSTAEA